MKISKMQSASFNTNSQNTNNTSMNNQFPRTLVSCNNINCKFNKNKRCTSRRVELDISISTNGITKLTCKTYVKLNNFLN